MGFGSGGILGGGDKDVGNVVENNDEDYGGGNMKKSHSFSLHFHRRKSERKSSRNVSVNGVKDVEMDVSEGDGGGGGGVKREGGEEMIVDERDLKDVLAPPRRLLGDARRKLGETFDVRHEGLRGLKELIERYNESTPKAQRVEFMRKDDWFLMAFLRCKKFNVQRAFDEFLNYSTFHYENGWLRDGVDRDLVRRMFSSGGFQVLPSRDPSGRLILSMGTKALVPMVEELGPSRIMEIVKAVFFLLEVVIADIEAQIFGAAIVADFSACKIKILTYLSPSEYQMCLHLCQACYPLRANGMYIIREPWYMRTVWAIIRPFMNTKVKRRFKTFGKDWTGMYEYIPKKSLTPLYGGEFIFDAEAAAKRWIAAVDAMVARG
eukprot:Plantae.Rhodophyta-Hildenbrandia_rubra.ctg27290.p1 GENE.Plantae.Rhodophyta-Hildenbrandia_rubra.ctg27290~~Plantae.Rhodophyta-Hildenbrandia_rubra.ctg27290.p1  ORF type:complete len:377 (-),score=103.78 Plantae.Rhodophyta-Hildenbrandia_rubra.ctg27290:346-1476(-)